MPTTVTTRTPPSTQTVRSRRRLLAELRARGARGGVIQPHRAMVGARLTPWRAAEMTALPLLLALGVVLALPSITRLWAALFERLVPELALPGGVAYHTVQLSRLLAVTFPFPAAEAAPPGALHFAVVGLLSAVVLLVSLLLPARWLPLAYALRFALVIQASAFLVFALPGDQFPYRLPAYALGFLQMGAVMLGIAPIVLGLVYFPFDVALWRKVALAALVVAHGAVLLPLQTLAHVWLAHRLSLLVLPTLFFVFGALVEIFAFVAFYGWGMSWPAVAQGPGSRGPGPGRDAAAPVETSRPGPRTRTPGPRGSA